MSTQGGSGVGSGADKYDDAKDFLDKIGQKVYDEIVKKGVAETYKGELKGNLTSSTFFVRETVSSLDPCQLESKYTELISGSGVAGGSGGSLASGVAARGDPCKKDTNGNDVDRFSVKEQAEYDNKKMKCSNGKNEGACAPFRRLHLCNKNMVKMDTNNDDSSKAKHNLLVDVCMAAKYEGETLTRYHPQYQNKYGDSQICTVLARSFADIGDIVRGRDLYRRDKGEETKLENNLKEIFKQIHEDVMKTSDKNGELKTRYQDDNGGNYYQLREDWWTANRETVWKAITCSADRVNAYFRKTCNEDGTSSCAIHQCRCQKKDGRHDSDQVPTYFDYVPQYLRWFEEWAEDFCRKKNKKVENAKNKCRGKDKYNQERYCSLNGCDCTKTVRARGKLRYGNRCIDCLYACYPYVDWIDNQRKQFLKQKEEFEKQVKKYKTEISDGVGSGSSRKTRAASTTNYEEYEKKFYDELKAKYEDEGLNKFLEKLSDEEVCKIFKEKEEGRIDFKN
ncbi:hypothetical protein PFFCH_05300, partial [Plasmodium falciparum FCH/4]